jgi:hypothetical protein
MWLREGQQDVAPGRATDRQLHSVSHSIIGGNDDDDDEYFSEEAPSLEYSDDEYMDGDDEEEENEKDEKGEEGEEGDEGDEDDDEDEADEPPVGEEQARIQSADQKAIGMHSNDEHVDGDDEEEENEKDEKGEEGEEGDEGDEDDDEDEANESPVGEEQARIQSADQKAIGMLIENLRATVVALSSSRGSKTVEEQTMLDCISAAVMSPQLVDLRLMSAVSRSVGLSRRQQTRGLGLRKLREERESLVLRVPRAPHSFGSKAKKDLDWVYDWFHNECNLVEVDKSKRNKYRRKIAKVAGKIRKLTCQRRVMTGTKLQLVSAFISSDVYSNYTNRTGMTIGERTVEGCICPCIKEATLLDCVCPMCVEFRYLLKAWHTQRQVWHQATPCRCSGCQGPRWVSRLQLISNNKLCCFRRYQAYRRASKSVSDFRRAISCGRVPQPHLTLPYLPEEVPEFYPLACCGSKTPKHVTQCTVCGWRQRCSVCSTIFEL